MTPEDMPMRYEGQKALVVGASGEIGQAIASELLGHGCDVALVYRKNRQALTELETLAQKQGRRSLPIQLDLRCRENIQTLAENFGQAFGRPTILVLSAGIFFDQPISKISDEDWYAVLETNLSGPFFVLRSLVPMMMRGGGRIVIISSLSGLYGQPGQSNYAAAEGGLIAMTRSLARELGPFNITVNAIAPGFVETQMTEDLPDTFRRRLLQRIPSRRFATPQDLIPAARLLMSTEGKYVDGHVLVVDGGLSA